MCQNNQQSSAVVLAYDLITIDDSNIDTEIKGYLGKDWQDVAITDEYLNVIGYYAKCKRELPATTLINYNSTIEQAKGDFCRALILYNDNHLDDKPKKRMAHYRHAAVFAVSDYEVLPPHL